MTRTDNNTDSPISATELRTREMLRQAGFDELVEGLWGKVDGVATAYIECNPTKRTALTWAFIPGEALFLGSHVTFSAPNIEQAVSAALALITQRTADEARGITVARHAEPVREATQL